VTREYGLTVAELRAQLDAAQAENARLEETSDAYGRVTEDHARLRAENAALRRQLQEIQEDITDIAMGRPVHPPRTTPAPVASAPKP
jgi:DNA-binding transcriptional MerR regulator